MFELSVALKYLIPKKKRLSVSLIALMSVGVISLVVWLLLVFLSVTEGIEQGWLKKLTALNAPIKITPTSAYYSSYYYQVDGISSLSQYTLKTLGEKAVAPQTDPYSPTQDMEIPRDWPQPEKKWDGSLKDPVKELYSILLSFKKSDPSVVFQDYELSGAMMRLQMLRPVSAEISTRGDQSQSFLTQVCYLASFADQSPYLQSLLMSPTMQDLNHLFYLANHAQNVSSENGFASHLASLTEHLSLKELKSTRNFWQLPPALLPDGFSFSALAYLDEDHITHLLLPQTLKTLKEEGKYICGTLRKKQGELLFQPYGKTDAHLISSVPLIIQEEVHLKADFVADSLKNARQLKEVRFNVEFLLQGVLLKGEIPWDGLEVSQAQMQTAFDTPPTISPPWVYTLKKEERSILPLREESPILIAKSFRDNGVRIGDRGYLSYAAPSVSSLQEQRIPIYVAGFYDPGIMTVGNRCALVPRQITRAANISNNPAFSFEKTLSNGFQVWFSNIDEAEKIKEQLEDALKQKGVNHYWKVTTFRDYDFAKDLLQQFQSDKYLFTLLGVIILVVACCNIISLLVLLVNDKKKEIGILRAMGASSKSIAAIFGICGVGMGILSSCLGILVALFTLNHLDTLVSWLSFLQGHEAFNAAFYGTSLPKQLSQDALSFVVIATPLISFCAGLVPAIKACRLRPSSILRSE